MKNHPSRIKIRASLLTKIRKLTMNLKRLNRESSQKSPKTVRSSETNQNEHC